MSLGRSVAADDAPVCTACFRASVSDASDIAGQSNYYESVVVCRNCIQHFDAIKSYIPARTPRQPLRMHPIALPHLLEPARLPAEISPLSSPSDQPAAPLG